MAFTTYCTTKGCGQFQEPFIDPDDQKVYCSECESEILNLTSIAKNQMRMNKQFRKKKKKSYSTECKSCKKDDRPIILNDKICCPFCKKEHSHLSDVFKSMLKEQLLKL